MLLVELRRIIFTRKLSNIRQVVLHLCAQASWMDVDVEVPCFPVHSTRMPSSSPGSVRSREDALPVSLPLSFKQGLEIHLSTSTTWCWHVGYWRKMPTSISSALVVWFVRSYVVVYAVCVMDGIFKGSLVVIVIQHHYLSSILFWVIWLSSTVNCFTLTHNKLYIFIACFFWLLVYAVWVGYVKVFFLLFYLDNAAYAYISFWISSLALHYTSILKYI